MSIIDAGNCKQNPIYTHICIYLSIDICEIIAGISLWFPNCELIIAKSRSESDRSKRAPFPKVILI